MNSQCLSDTMQEKQYFDSKGQSSLEKIPKVKDNPIVHIASPYPVKISDFPSTNFSFFQHSYDLHFWIFLLEGGCLCTQMIPILGKKIFSL